MSCSFCFFEHAESNLSRLTPRTVNVTLNVYSSLKGIISHSSVHVNCSFFGGILNCPSVFIKIDPSLEEHSVPHHSLYKLFHSQRNCPLSISIHTHLSGEQVHSPSSTGVNWLTIKIRFFLQLSRLGYSQSDMQVSLYSVDLDSLAGNWIVSLGNLPLQQGSRLDPHLPKHSFGS